MIRASAVCGAHLTIHRASRARCVITRFSDSSGRLLQFKNHIPFATRRTSSAVVVSARALLMVLRANKLFTRPPSGVERPRSFPFRGIALTTGTLNSVSSQSQAAMRIVFIFVVLNTRGPPCAPYPFFARSSPFIVVRTFVHAAQERVGEIAQSEVRQNAREKFPHRNPPCLPNEDALASPDGEVSARRLLNACRTLPTGTWEKKRNRLS